MVWNELLLDLKCLTVCVCVCVCITLKSLTVVLLPVELFLQLVHLLPGVLHVQHLQHQIVDILHAGRGCLRSTVLLNLGCLPLLQRRRHHSGFNFNFKKIQTLKISTELTVVILHRASKFRK